MDAVIGITLLVIGIVLTMVALAVVGYTHAPYQSIWSEVEDKEVRIKDESAEGVHA